jgi:tRNA modification GTPase
MKNIHNFVLSYNYGMQKDSTICAIATPPGIGAISVIRVSGNNAFDICSKIIRFRDNKKRIRGLKPYTIHYASIIHNDKLIDEVLVSLFRAPHSYTGEDVVEISCHGAYYIQQHMLRILTDLGARLAKPGEFTLRAYLNGKLDLSQAEAVADLIASTTASAHRVALNQMKGGFSSEIAKVREQLLYFISLIELELDFSEEDVVFTDRKQLVQLIKRIHNLINSLIESFKLGNVLRHGVPVAITGKTNVGKSTLLNLLLHEEKAIVSEIAGTTRDVIEDVINIEGFSFRFIDTAGLRKASDKIESLGIEKTFQKIDQAYIVLYIIDAASDAEEIDRLAGKIKKRLQGKDKKLIIILNKIDLLSKKQLSRIKIISQFKNLDSSDAIIYLSAFNHKNIDLLISTLLEIVKQRVAGEHDVIVTNARHYEALKNAGDALNRVAKGLKSALSTDLLAQDIREVLHHLGEITGEVTTDEILGNIFSKFCIGK